MDFQTLAPFLAIAAVAGYFQTVTGFGLGMIVIGATSGLGIASVATVAAVVSLLALVNSAVALPGKLQHVHWPAARSVIVVIVPAIMAGVLLLDYLSASAQSLLRIALGGLVLYGGISLVWRPGQGRSETPSSRASFFISGTVAGLCGGLFGIAGPPLIYQFYRQPLPLVSIRNMLILCFSVTALTRTLFLAFQGSLDSQILLLALWAFPVIALTTWLGRRFPPPVSAVAMRRLVFLVLVGIGLNLIVSELLALVR